jgi:hypothetical protein
MKLATHASKLGVLVLVLALVSATSGCATLFAGGPDRVAVTTNPPGAYVYANGVIVGQTPTVVVLERSQPGQIQIYLPGYRAVALAKTKTMSGWFLVNFLFLSVLGVIIDLATGNWQHFDTSGINIGLVPDQGAAPVWYQGAPPPYAPPYGQPYPPQDPPPPQDPNYPPPPGPAPVQPGGPPQPGR